MSSFSQINTNIQSMQAFQSLQNTSSELSMRRERLSTGLRINSAEDDSAGFAIAKKLEAETRGQSQALKNITDAKSMLTVAEGGLNSSLDILQTMKEKAVQAANDSLGSSERAAIQGQLVELTEEIDDIIGTTNFNGNQLLDGTGGQAGDGKLSFQVGAESSETFDVQLESAETNKLGMKQGPSVSGKNGLLFEGNLADDANTSLSGSGSLTFDGSKELSIDISMQDTGSTADVTIKGPGTGSSSIDDTQTIDTSAGSAETINLLDAAGAVGGTGALNLDISTANLSAIAEEGSASLSVFATESTLDVSDSASAGSAIDTIDSAINEVTDQLAGIGDAQKRLSFKNDNLETSRTNLESARSGIEDADFAREQMQIAKLQILQQTGTATLAQANASSQGVLSLIG
jgi:flagellin